MVGRGLSLGGQLVRRAVYVAKSVRDWLGSCHPQDDVVADVASQFALRLQKLRELGRLYGKETGDPVKKLAAFRGLWEIRVRHPTGAYRVWFMFTRIDSDEAVVVGDCAVKHRADFPHSRYETAERRVLDYAAALEPDVAFRERERMR